MTKASKITLFEKALKMDEQRKSYLIADTLFDFESSDGMFDFSYEKSLGKKYAK